MNTPRGPYDETMGVLHLLYSLVEVDFPPFVNDFHFKMEVIVDRKTFIFALVHSPCLFFMALYVWCTNFNEIVLSEMII
jgi:hypothetical protein